MIRVEFKKYIECDCGQLNEVGATTCKHCGRSLEHARTVAIRRVREPRIRLGWKAIGSLLFLIASLVFLADPFDLVPIPFFDALAIVVIAVAVWIVVIVLEYSREEKWMEVKEYEK
jgi:hypothetical protein